MNSGHKLNRDNVTKYDNIDQDGLIRSHDYVEGCISSLSPSLRSSIEQAIRNVQVANLKANHAGRREV